MASCKNSSEVYYFVGSKFLFARSVCIMECHTTSVAQDYVCNTMYAISHVPYVSGFRRFVAPSSFKALFS